MPQTNDEKNKQRVLAEELREAREYLGLSQDLVAKRLGVPRSTISAIEGGKRKVSFLELQELADLYRRSVKSFASDPEPGVDEDERLPKALFRAARKLSDEDRERVLRFAEFLRVDDQRHQTGGE